MDVNLEKLEKWKDELDEIDADSWAILENASAENLDWLSLKENEELERLDKRYNSLAGLVEHYQIELEAVDTPERENNMSTKFYNNIGQGRKTDFDDVVNGKSGGNVGNFKPTGENNGFKNLGDLGVSVYNAGLPGRNPDPRLFKNAPTPATEGTGAEGGFAVPYDFRNEIMIKVMGEESLLSRCDVDYTPSNAIERPADETSPWDSTDGIQAYWDSEASQLTQSKLNLKSKTIKLSKLTALIPVSNELLEDAPGLNSYLNKKVPVKFTSKINSAIISGTGVGMPQGILNCSCLVTINKESGQNADTVLYENIIHMWARLYGPSQTRSVWLINQDITSQLFSMSWEGTSSSVPAYMPANGLSDSPYGTLMGRPVIPVQACKTIGDKGDIILADLEQYAVAMKQEGVRQDVSMHLWFDYDVMAFRFILRVQGQCWWSSDITPENSSDHLGHFVVLEART